MENKLTQIIEYLFDRYWDEDISEDEENVLLQAAEKTVSEYGWKQTYSAAKEYLHQKCITPESAINFAHLYWFYFWYKKPIPDPYAFLAYFYYRIDWQTEKYDDSDILDSLVRSILTKAGYREADLVLNPRYMPENDPVLQKEVEKYKFGF